jgi:hypothetical protein
MADMYHPPASHASTVGPDGRQFSRRPGNRGGSAPFFAANGEAIVAQTGVRGLKNRLFRLMTKRQKEALFANTARAMQIVACFPQLRGGFMCIRAMGVDQA